LVIVEKEKKEMFPAYFQTQLALSDLLAVSINTSNSCSTTNGPRPDRVQQLLLALNAAKALKNNTLSPQEYVIAQALIANYYTYGY
jgi:hypothetical protein